MALGHAEHCFALIVIIEKVYNMSYPMTPEGMLELSYDYGSSEIDPITREAVIDTIVLIPHTHDMFVWLKYDFAEMIKPMFGNLIYDYIDNCFKMRFFSMNDADVSVKEKQFFDKAIMEYHRDKSGNLKRKDEQNTKSE